MEDTAVLGGAPAPGTAADRQKRERRFYCRMALATVVFIFLGFAPTFYLKPFALFQYPRPAPDLNPVLMFHGLVFSAWVAITVAQTQLVAAGRRDIHRKLGIAGFTLAACMIPIMYIAMMDEVGRNSTPPYADVLTWSVVPLSPIPVYIAMLVLGWRARKRDLQAHKRYMLGFMIMLTQPATARLPLLPPSVAGFFGLSLISALLFIPMILWDKRTIGKVHPATALTIALYMLVLAVQVFFLSVPGLWSAFTTILPGIGR